MAKYRLPIQAISYVEVEADTLQEAILNINNGVPDVPGINVSEVFNWEIDQWSSFEKDNELVMDSEGNDLYLSDIMDHTKY